MALSPGGFALMLMMPIAGRLTGTKVDPRLLVACGFLSMGITLHLMTIIYLGISFKTIVLLRVLQVLPMAFIFIPISTLNYIGVPREKNNQVSGMSNFARNIGGSIGTSLLSTFIARQNQTNENAFAAHTSRGDLNFQQYLAGLKAVFVGQGFDATTATTKALAMAYQTVLAQANALSFKNSFWGLSIMVLCLVPLPFVMRRPRPGQGRASAAH
jgi:DHA2 family multidrug resistance protein